MSRYKYLQQPFFFASSKVLRTPQVAQNQANKECNELVNEETRLRRDLTTQTANCAKLTSDNQIGAASLKSMEHSLAGAKTENSRQALPPSSAFPFLLSIPFCFKNPFRILGIPVPPTPCLPFPGLFKEWSIKFRHTPE